MIILFLRSLYPQWRTKSCITPGNTVDLRPLLPPRRLHCLLSFLRISLCLFSFPLSPPPSRSTSVDFPFPSLPLIISFVFSPSADLWSTDHGPQCYADGAVRSKGRELGWKVGSRCHCRSSICCPRFVAVYSCRPAVVAGYICCSRVWFAVCGFLQVSVARAVGVSFRPAPLFARLIAGLSAARGVAPVSAAAK